MGNYVPNHTPPAQMSVDEIRAEAKDLRVRITTIESELSQRQAWALADKRDQSTGHATWLARTRDLRGLLVNRYAVVRPREKELNRGKRQ